MDPGHGELSQDADGADSAPGKRAACAFHVQPPALDTDFHPSPQKKTNSRGRLTFNLLLEKLTLVVQFRTRTSFHFHGHDVEVHIAGLEHFIISSVVWSNLKKPSTFLNA